MLSLQLAGVGVVGTVAGGGDPAELEPIVVADPVAVHRAVHEDRRHTLLMLGEDLLQKGRVLDVGETLVVEDDVIALRPIGFVVDRDRMIGRRAPSCTTVVRIRARAAIPLAMSTFWAS